jgi:hypothetical protein
MWIQIMLLTWIRGGPSQVMCLLLVDVLLAGGLPCRMFQYNLHLRLSIWLSMKHIKRLFG